MERIDAKLSLTPTVARQTPKSEFSGVLRNALQVGGNMMRGAASVVPGGGIVSAAIGSATDAAIAGGSQGLDAGGPLQGEVAQMKAQADQSLALQIAMQNESREYTTLSNVIKMRHDSARAAINNIH